MSTTVKVRSIVEDLDVVIKSSSSSIKSVKYRITRLIGIDVEHLRISFQGYVYPDTLALSGLPGGFTGDMVLKLEFNRTELAREQTYRYVKKKGWETEKFRSLSKQLFQQEDEWNGWDERQLPPLPESPPVEPRKGKIGKFFDKINPPKTPAEKALNKRVKERGKKIEDALRRAYLEIPGFYTDTGLMFIEVEINNTPIKACLDTGAEISVMLASCAEKCGLSALIDERQGGTVTGMGTTLNLGRINRTKFKIGGEEGYFHISVVLTGATECLLGLDFIKHFGIVINVGKGLVKMGDEEIPLVPYNSIPERIDTMPVLDTLVKMFSEDAKITKNDEE